MANPLNKTLDSYNLEIIKVEVNPKSCKWILHIKNHIDFDVQKLIEDIKKQIKGLKEVEVRPIKENFEEYILSKKESINQILRSYNPKMFLPQNNWIIDNNMVTIPLLLKEDYETLYNSDISEKLHSFLKEQDAIDISFSFTYREKIKDFAFEINKQKKALQVEISKQNAHASSKSLSTKKDEIIFGKKITSDVKQIVDCTADEQNTIGGTIFDLSFRDIKNNKSIISFNITDYTSSMTVKFFIGQDKKDEVLNRIKEAKALKIKGRVLFDSFAKENVVMADSIQETYVKVKTDDSPIKRVELHLHSQYSSMDSVAKIKNVIDKAIQYGHKSLAITDHGVLQGFPDAMEHSRGKDIKIIYGLEGYLVDDYKSSKWGKKDSNFEDTFIIFDIETTGLSSQNNEIIEIGAVKVRNYQVIETFTSFVKPKMKIPIKITEITGITNDMVMNQEPIEIVLPKFLDFCEEHILVAHNAKFDLSFIEKSCSRLSLSRDFSVIDTLSLARSAIPQISRHNLKALTNFYKIKLDNHHRALDDAMATAKIFINLIKTSEENGAKSANDINHVFDNQRAVQRMDMNHVIILVKNYTGLKNLYKLVSDSHLKYFYKKPRIPKSLLNKYREGLIIGSACENSEIFKSILNDTSTEELADIVSFYDYLEVQPLGNNQFMVDNNRVNSVSDLIEINKKIIDLATDYNKLVVATGDVHFLEPHDEYYRRILMHGQGFRDADKQAPLYYRTTQEMLEEFNYLNKETAEKIVIHNTNAISDLIEKITPIPDGTFPPIMEGSDEEIREMVMGNAYSKYGKPLPKIVEARLDKELTSIIKNGYSVLYLVAHKLVKKSNDEGYLVGSRGSVGSSLVATFCNITEVNPLQPHYICPNCQHSEFFDSNDVGVGPDLHNKDCIICGTPYDKDGFDIPFEVFLGFEADKEPDIDLNFSGEYQAIAHKYTEELFGVGKTFKAGTISTIADKTAYGFVKNYLEETNKTITNAEISRLVGGCSGIKKTSGQHPGGIMVVPEYKDIYDFCPIQKPADDMDSEIITTHFDYHSISGRLLKLDILGHDDPTMIRMLEDITGIDAKSIPLDDKKTMDIFTTNEVLNLVDKDIGSPIGTYGIPEFGTHFVREMLLTTKPTAFADLVRISGLSHGTDVWLNNAQSLIQQETATIKDVICTRDDIMVYLIYKGLPSKNSFTIMEKVRKGKGLNDDDVKLMKEYSIPEWYIDSCNKIKYMFPKAHAVAYVTMAFRIAYCKVHYPLAYYATYFSIRADEFDAHIAIQGKDVVRKHVCEMKKLGNNASTKEKSQLTILELILEMLCRGFEFLPVDLMQSHYNKFIIVGNKLLPPFNALEGIGDKAALNLYNSKYQGDFLSIEDLQKRAKLSKTNIEVLTKHGSINFLPVSNQISLF
ncbi:PolC-type DNA polymerase III [Alkalibaculum sp. M08DMB]|uniref:DNA polymerase III PolC-type n=1 Tax=Alkalibaculum sporogenes TaxID=2655001 RepID=A0A6A7K8P3_9FIRM|nr:PolC-type DNA polymerase III [Alkalibaculum sporogenes]